MSLIFGGHKDFKDCDYVIAWYLKAAEFTKRCDATFAFVSTSSISEASRSATFGLGSMARAVTSFLRTKDSNGETTHRTSYP
jgi:hypothetical protein